MFYICETKNVKTNIQKQFNMNIGNTKNLLVIIVVAILSSVVTLLGYNAINKKQLPFGNQSDNSLSMVDVGEYAT
ncbi:MAG TPA: hypothetical protein DDZ78_13725, partial [Porphyromonadaceae bacterium]|nr:hypothetical protein [Porphyromonadaceae bacterium]